VTFDASIRKTEKRGLPLKERGVHMKYERFHQEKKKGPWVGNGWPRKIHGSFFN